MFKNRNFTIANFCKLTDAGLQIAEFVDIRNTLIERYKTVYGSDIDVSTASADGVFINDLSLIINNILQTMSAMYSNLDVNTASGIYLDSLCRLSNVVRQQATHSTSSVIIKNITDENQTFGDKDANGNIINNITFIDNAGNEWISNVSVTLAANTSTSIKITAVDSGPISAPAGWINKTLLAMNLLVTQPDDAIVGQPIESDQALRLRRSQSSGARGVSVLESLVAALLEIAGIKDVRIYNNSTLTEQVMADATTIPAHCVYVILRLQSGIVIDDSVIGNLIMNKLTPGIKTVVSKSSIQDEHKHYEYIPQLLGVAVHQFNRDVYWKQAIGIHPEITITLTSTQYFDENEAQDIFESVQSYANNLFIADRIDTNEIYSIVYESDPLFKGQRTYRLMPSDVTIVSTDNPDTFYEYTNYTITKTNDKYVIKIN